MQDTVKMTHPDIEGSPEVTIKAFDEVWSPLGWALVGETSREQQFSFEDPEDNPEEENNT